jgi:hypothetical protein
VRRLPRSYDYNLAMPDSSGREPKAIAFSSDRRYELTLYYRDGFFQSLNWDCVENNDRVEVSVITATDFQAGHRLVRYVSDVHSIAVSGKAVILVAEHGDPVSNGELTTMTVEFSWRLWDLRKKKELRILKRCSGPFDRFS